MNPDSFDWDRLKVFAAVADTGSINAAATRLGKSPGKVSRDVDDLERSLGQKLFLRTTRGMELTTVGAMVLKSTRTVSDATRAIATYAKEAAAPGGPCKVTIAAHDAMATYWLARQLPAFHRANPSIEVRLRVVSETPNVAAGDADISIQYEEPTAANTIARPLGWLHYILYATPAYLDVHGIPETMFDLGKHRFLMHEGYNKQVELWEPKTPAWLDVIASAVQTNSSTVILENCANGGGIALMPTYVSEFERRVQPLRHIKPLAAIRFWLAYTPQARAEHRYEPVLDWLRDLFDPADHPCFRETYVAPKQLEG